jgi:hypothetical protein
MMLEMMMMMMMMKKTTPAHRHNKEQMKHKHCTSQNDATCLVSLLISQNNQFSHPLVHALPEVDERLLSSLRRRSLLEHRPRLLQHAHQALAGRSVHGQLMGMKSWMRGCRQLAKR